MWATVLVFFVAMLGGSLSAVILAPKLRAAGIVGKDLHKPSQPEIPEMGGLALDRRLYLGHPFCHRP